MELQTRSGTAECPECFVEFQLDDVAESEIVECDDCGVELEVVELAALRLELAPQEDEDWGE